MMAESSEGRIDASDSVHGILYLPQPIVQKIMSCLPPRVAAQISILSKDWNHAFNTLPTLEFDEETFGRKDVGGHDADIENDTFLEYVDGYITRRREHDLNIDSMSLLVFSKGDKLSLVLPKWIDIASRLNLRDLTLGRIVDYPNRRWYDHKCPDLVSDTISVLHVSHLYMKGVKTRLPRLEELVLHRVDESSDVLNELMLSCPALRRVELIEYSHFGDLLICGPKLETFEASGMYRVNSFSISAPNLMSFSFTSTLTIGLPDGELSTLQVHGAQNLRELTLDLCVVGIRTIREAVSRLRLLETLRLRGRLSAERIRITHKNLKHLVLTRFDSLRRVKTQTPNLVSFQYDGLNIPIIGPRDSTRLASARLEVDFGVRTKRSYLKAAKFLRYFGRCDSLTLICNNVEALVLPEEIRSVMLPPLHNVKHLKLQILFNTPEVNASSSQLTESLRWMGPHLETLVVSSEPRHEKTPCPHSETPVIGSKPHRDKYSRANRKRGRSETAAAGTRDALSTKKTHPASSVGSSRV
ncbi:F-box/LRR-repeat protein At1g06630-like [Syzygium oleosum]|uniref:F-box/LRR-repeat protein At1g06630-like n=1 Tax=Syzygium oleosum TaxID=219896 RepID=UPI0024B9258E|nr:F-box/LRR-repeat protein At1g06630-like [Syzygium oleosum]